MPDQPIPFSHRLHAGEMGIDCRYCHTNVEKSPHASVPPAQVCMNCHSQVKKESPVLETLRSRFQKYIETNKKVDGQDVKVKVVNDDYLKAIPWLEFTTHQIMHILTTVLTSMPTSVVSSVMVVSIK